MSDKNSCENSCGCKKDIIDKENVMGKLNDIKITLEKIDSGELTGQFIDWGKMVKDLEISIAYFEGH